MPTMFRSAAKTRKPAVRMARYAAPQKNNARLRASAGDLEAARAALRQWRDRQPEKVREYNCAYNRR